MTTEALVMRYFRAWQHGDLESLRSCLADEIRFDWGAAVYTDPDEFVAASAQGIVWADVVMLGSVFTERHAAIVYEATNLTDGVRVRTAEYLTVSGNVISEAVVVFTTVG
jgi:ketosteroid isomerase-like protein